MKIKSLLFAGLLFTSCANQTEPISIAKFHLLGPGCDTVTFEKTSFISNGFLDVAAGNAQFFVGLSITGGENIQQNEVLVGGSILEQKNRNRPLVLQQVINYRLSKRVGGLPKPYITNMNVPFVAGKAILGTQLISPELALALFEGLAPSPGQAPSSVVDDFVDILVDVEYKGEFSASKHSFSTGVLTFPIRAYRSNPMACMNGFQKTPKDPCEYVGQSTSQLVPPKPPAACCAVAGC